MAYKLETRSGHNMFTMMSMLQKSIRRGDNQRAGYAAMELFGFYNTVMWNRTMVVANEDCWGILAKEIVALRYEDLVRNNHLKGYEKDTQYISKAISLLCNAKKSRDACYFACNFVLQTYIENPGRLQKDFLEQTKEEMSNMAEDALDIKNINGEVGKWEAPTSPNNGKQMSIFDMTSTPVQEDLIIYSYDDKKTKCEKLSAYLRKAIRTLDMELAGYAVYHLRQLDLLYAWKTLYVISRNECGGIPTNEIVALKHADDYINKSKPLDKREGINICKGIMILMYHINGNYDSILGNDMMNYNSLINWDGQEYMDIRDCTLQDDQVPEWVYDVHTLKGKRNGKTDWGMNIVEYDGLNPKEKGFFDEGSWQPRYEYKHLHGLCSEWEYQQMLETSKTRKGNPVEKISDKFQ